MPRISRNRTSPRESQLARVKIAVCGGVRRNRWNIYVFLFVLTEKYPINCNEWFIVEAEKEMYIYFSFRQYFGKKRWCELFFCVFAPTDAIGGDSLASEKGTENADVELPSRQEIP